MSADEALTETQEKRGRYGGNHGRDAVPTRMIQIFQSLPHAPLR